jgi:hypothetical protein
MEINKENYEAFLLDLWEGTLSEDQKMLLYSFLDKHPELDEGDALALLDDVSFTKSNAEFDQEAIDFEKINKKNYEYFFIAYSEGDLSKSEMESVDAFLSNHPSLVKKFDQFNKARLTEEEFDTVNGIKKEGLDFENISIENYQFFFIAYAEGDLSSAQTNQVDTFVLDHPELSQEFDQFKRAKLPVEEITFPNKELLLSETTPVISLQSRWLIGIAAASAAVFFWFSSPIQSVDNKYAKNDGTAINIKQHEISSDKTFTSPEKSSSKQDLYKSNSTNSMAQKSGKEIKSEKETHNDIAGIKNIEIPELKMKSVSSIKTNQLPDVLASINPKSQNSDNKIVPDGNEKIKEEIPTVLELTTAYLQRKNLLNEDRKPNLKGILNNTLASSNNDQPVLETTEASNSKRTVFKLGDFKVERIAKK